MEPSKAWEEYKKTKPKYIFQSATDNIVVECKAADGNICVDKFS